MNKIQINVIEEIRNISDSARNRATYAKLHSRGSNPTEPLTLGRA